MTSFCMPMRREIQVTNLSLNLIETASRRPDDIALRLDESEIGFSNLDAASACIAGLLMSRGLRPGARVGVMLPNVPYFAMVYYGVLRAGGVVVPMNVLLTKHEVTFHLSDSAAQFVFVWPDFAPAAQAGADAVGAICVVVTPGDFEEMIVEAEPLEDPVARDDTETAVILYTPKTGGSPKSAELTHAELRENIAKVVDLLGLSESDVILAALPLFYAFGQTAGLNASVATGSCLTLIPRFTADRAIKIIERDQVTVFEGLPGMFEEMLHRGAHEHTRSLRLCVSGGEALPADVMRAVQDEFHCPVLEGYGP